MSPGKMEKAHRYDVGDDADIPFVTVDQMREVDRLLEEEYGILLVQTMENAGRGLAELAISRFLESGSPKGRVLVLAGTGGNGGGGLVCARHLHNWGVEIVIFITAPHSSFRKVPAIQLGIVTRLRVPVTHYVEGARLPSADLIIDAVIGYSLRGAPKGEAADLISDANAHGAPILSLDIPSGLDATTGAIYKPAIEATATLTLALPKTGLQTQAGLRHAGEVYLGDIGVPPQLYARPTLGLAVGPIFEKGGIVQLY